FLGIVVYRNNNLLQDRLATFLVFVSYIHNILDDGPDSGQCLSVTPPFVNPEPLLHIDVIEDPPEDSSGPLHDDCAPLQRDVRIFWNVD
ncbi:hypothetical protein STEG23_009289, partial [Scotinomys teguina]